MPTIPTNFDGVTFYYWKGLTPTTGQLCSDAGLTTPVVPGSNSAGVFLLGVPANALPADTSGMGTINGGIVSGGGQCRMGVKLGVMRLCQAMGMDDSGQSVTDAIANCKAIVDALGVNYDGDGATYSWDNVL